jgi:hypothetical protein
MSKYLPTIRGQSAAKSPSAGVGNDGARVLAGQRLQLYRRLCSAFFTVSELFFSKLFSSVLIGVIGGIEYEKK